MEMAALLAWIIIGSISGLVAGSIMKTRDVGTNMIVGIAGTFINGIFFNAFGLTGIMGFNIWSICVAFIGTVGLLMVIRLFSGSETLSIRNLRK